MVMKCKGVWSPQGKQLAYRELVRENYLTLGVCMI